MGRQLIDLVGKTFERLTVISCEGRNKNGQHVWRCKCTCGNETLSLGYKLQQGKKKSCGCFQKELLAIRGRKVLTTHGLSSTPEYIAWRDAKQRCCNPKNKRYEIYGKRGIKMCERWLNSFADFSKDMGSRPSVEHSLDRIWNDGPYSPDNCRWATNSEQQKNKRRSK